MIDIRRDSNGKIILDPVRDMIVLESVESYMRKKGVQPGIDPMDAITKENLYKGELYSSIVERVPVYALYILESDFDNDKKAQGLLEALTNHSLDPMFISVLLQYLDQLHDPDTPKARAATGALLVDIVGRYITKKCNITIDANEDKKKNKKEEKISEEANAETAEIRRAARLLLSDLARAVQDRCAEIDEANALVIAGAIIVGGNVAIKKLIAIDYPITADVFEIVRRDRTVFDSIIRAALLLEAADYTKLTDNQKTFIASLKRWVYSCINELGNPQAILTFLVSVYKSARPVGTQKYLIQIKDCGSSYGYLLSVARQMIISDKD